MIRSVSVIVPAFNEETRLPQSLERIWQYLRGADLDFSEIVVVDDGSTDQTGVVAEAFAKTHGGVRVLRNAGNRGKGFSVRCGMLEARGEWRLFSDADLSAPIEELEKLSRVARETRADVVIGSRALDRSLIEVHQPAFRETAGKFFNFVMQLAVGLAIQDTQCGFKLFSQRAAVETFSRLKLERFGFDVEALFIARKRGFRIEEVPVRWSHVEGTKVSLWNGAQSFVDLFVIRLHQLAGRYR